jgi:hypothetical protein
MLGAAATLGTRDRRVRLLVGSKSVSGHHPPAYGGDGRTWDAVVRSARHLGPKLPPAAAPFPTEFGCGWCHMASDLVIASVTAALKDLLESGLADHNVLANLGAEAIVTTIPPDRVPVGGCERPQINLFLYQVTPFTTLPRGDSRPTVGNLRPVGAPLLLDLHYLISAYGTLDLQSEVLLGLVLRLLHDHPVLDREQIRRSLEERLPANGSAPTAPVYAALAESTLPDSVERVRIQPEFPSTDELARLWSALQARFRPSASYKVSAVVIDG